MCSCQKPVSGSAGLCLSMGLAAAQLPFRPDVKVSFSQCRKATLSCADTKLLPTRGCASPCSVGEAEPRQVPSSLHSRAQHQPQRDPDVLPQNTAIPSLPSGLSHCFVLGAQWPSSVPRLIPKEPKKPSGITELYSQASEGRVYILPIFQQLELKSSNKSFLALQQF